MPSPKMRRSTPSGKGRAAPAGAAKRPAERDRIAAIFARFEAAQSAPATELDYADAFTLLVAVVLSAQATDVSVNKATPGLFALAPNPAAMVALGVDRVREAIRTIGLYNTKAKNVVALSEALLRDHGGAVPRSRAALERLPGVGGKTAAVVVNALWGDHAIAVDTHVFRVSNRLPIAPGRTPAAVEAGLMEAVPDAYKRHAHHWLILHGRYTCTARRPACPRCPVRDLCLWPEKTPGEPEATATRG